MAIVLGTFTHSRARNIGLSSESVILLLQVKRELNRSHWSKSARSFLCSDIIYRLAKKQRSCEFFFILLFPNISPLAERAYERDHKKVEVFKGQ